MCKTCVRLKTTIVEIIIIMNILWSLLLNESTIMWQHILEHNFEASNCMLRDFNVIENSKQSKGLGHKFMRWGKTICLALFNLVVRFGIFVVSRPLLKNDQERIYIW
jgi:hypothetical protein